jgi:alkylation response protein AidB-like acyl-CoA dehydrogenase
MHLTPGEDQEQLRSAVRGFLERRCGEREVRRCMETDQGYDPGAWRLATEQLGLSGLDVPELLGGSGASFRELAVVGEELGRTLACLPWMSSAVLAVGALLHSGEHGDLLREVAAGTTSAALAVAEAAGTWSEIATTATRVDGGWLLTGSKCFVLDGATADVLLVAAQAPGGLTLFAVPGTAAVREPLDTLDRTRKQARVTLDRAKGELVGVQGAAAEVLARVQDRAVTALACENLGVATKTLEMAVAYAKDRVQFGRSIGSFQAVRHRLADMAGQVEAARSAVAWAAACAAEGPFQRRAAGRSGTSPRTAARAPRGLRACEPARRFPQRAAAAFPSCSAPSSTGRTAPWSRFLGGRPRPRRS